MVLVALAFTPNRHHPNLEQAIAVQIIQEVPPEPEQKPEPPKPDPPKVEKEQPKDDDKEALKKLLRKPRRTPIKPITKPTPTKKKPKPTRTPIPTRPPNMKSITDVEPQPVAVSTPVQSAAPIEFTNSGHRDPGYLDRLTRAIQAKWNVPTARTNADYDLEGRVEFQIRANGYIVNVRILSGSGWSELDDSVVEAIEAVGKHSEPPPAESLQGGTAGVRYRFKLGRPIE